MVSSEVKRKIASLFSFALIAHSYLKLTTFELTSASDASNVILFFQPAISKTASLSVHLEELLSSTTHLGKLALLTPALIPKAIAIISIIEIKTYPLFKCLLKLHAVKG